MGNRLNALLGQFSQVDIFLAYRKESNLDHVMLGRHSWLGKCDWWRAQDMRSESQRRFLSETLCYTEAGGQNFRHYMYVCICMTIHVSNILFDLLFNMFPELISEFRQSHRLCFWYGLAAAWPSVLSLPALRRDQDHHRWPFNNCLTIDRGQSLPVVNH